MKFAFQYYSNILGISLPFLFVERIPAKLEKILQFYAWIIHKFANPKHSPMLFLNNGHISE